MRTVIADADPFAIALDRIREVAARPEFEIEEAPAPGRLAPDALALTVDVTSGDSADLASGRFVLLHDADGVEEWGGTFRAVVFVRASIETDLASDPMLSEVGWSWLVDSLGSAEAQATQVGGTVTRTFGTSYGTMADRPSDGTIEIRASWTPVSADDSPVEGLMGRHVEAWLTLLEHAAGLTPAPSGVAHVGTGRRRIRG